MEEELRKKWKSEENIAKINGWDFSYLENRYNEKTLSWSYYEIIKKYLKDEMKLLDIDTGGGEFLLSLKHPFENTSCTEGYEPNVELCMNKLKPLGINFKEAKDVAKLPFDDNSFDIVIDRHGSYNPIEVKRVLKDNGLFITQQVGEKNDEDLVKILLPNNHTKYPNFNLTSQKELFEKNGFEIIDQKEEFGKIEFYDVGAIVWFSKIIEWEFEGFSVDKCFNKLLECFKIIEKEGKFETKTHRFLLVCKNKKYLKKL